MSGIHELVMQLCGLLEDESAVTVRLAVSALKLCMPSLSHSCQSSLAMKLLLAVMPLKHNSYWLVKVSSAIIASASVYMSLPMAGSISHIVFGHSG